MIKRMKSTYLLYCTLKQNETRNNQNINRIKKKKAMEKMHIVTNCLQKH